MYKGPAAWAAESAATLSVDPGDAPYSIDRGMILKKNVSLICVNGQYRGGIYAYQR
jgi:hypothetical protein